MKIEVNLQSQEDLKHQLFILFMSKEINLGGKDGGLLVICFKNIIGKFCNTLYYNIENVQNMLFKEL